MDKGRPSTKPREFSALRMYRRLAGLSGPQLAKKLGVHNSTVTKWENKERRITEPYWDRLLDILEPFGCRSIDHLLGRPIRGENGKMTELRVALTALTESQLASILGVTVNMLKLGEPEEAREAEKKGSRRKPW